MLARIPHQVLLLLLSVVFTASGQAQDWQNLCKRVDSLREASNYSAAISVAQQALDVARKTFGDNHVNYAGSLKQLGEVQAENGDYPLSESTTAASRDLYRKLSSVQDSNYINTTVTLGVIARFQGKFLAAETYYIEALDLTEKREGKETLGYVDILGDLGTVYLVAGNLPKAESVLLTTLVLKAKLHGTESMEYATTLNSLGQLYGEKDDFARAESYLVESIQTRERVLKANDNPSITPPLANLAFIYERQGNYYEALKLYNRVISILEKRGIKSQIYLAALNNAGTTYTTIKAYQQADSLYEKLQPLLEKNVGTDTQQYAVLLGNRGVLQRLLKNYNAARQLLEQAYLLCVKKSTENNPFAVNMMANLAETYSLLGEEKMADSLFRNMNVRGETIVGFRNSNYADYLDKYSQFSINTNRLDNALTLIEKATGIVRSTLTKSFLYQTARQQERMLVKNSPFVNTAFEIAFLIPNQPHAAQLAYSGTLFLKNLLLSQRISLLGNETQTADAKLQLLTDTLRQVSNQVAAQYALPIAQRKNLDSLEARAETLEKDLARQSAPFRQAQQALQVTWENVRDALKPTEAAVEFVSFPHLNRGQETDTVRYLALVLRPGDKAPRVVPLLTDEAPLRRLLARRKGATLYATRGSELDSDQLSRGDSLYQLVWQPIDSLLSGVKTVYLSPSGLLHQVAFAALPYPNTTPKSGPFLADRYQLRQVGSTRQVAQPNPADDAYQRLTSAQLYGGIQYDSAGTASARTGGWPFLPGTAREVSEISTFMGAKATTITGAAATETEFKKQSGHSPSVLHVATHGFVFPDPAVSTADSSAGGWAFQRIANPLFRTGLLMAGANRVWQGGRPPLGEDDGILTAYEVANLNLTGTKLVVLSACETALGDIRGSEGVFGLQRAFKMAGAGYLLTSLWPVSDETTSTLMTQFYRNWKKYKTIRVAFQQTQQQMRQKYPPSVWAAFVLIE